MNSWIDLHALWKIVVIGLLAGAGLPMLFGIGLRALNSAPNGGEPRTQSGPASNDVVYGGNLLGLAAAALCFAVVLAAIGWGIYSIVAGS